MMKPEERIATKSREPVGTVTPVCHEICPNHYGQPTDLRCTLDRGHTEAHRHHLCEWPTLAQLLTALEQAVVEVAIAYVKGVGYDGNSLQQAADARAKFAENHNELIAKTESLIAARGASEQPISTDTIIEPDNTPRREDYGVMPRGLLYCVDHNDSHKNCAIAIAARESNTEVEK